MIGLGTQDTLGEAEEFLDKYGMKSVTMLWDESFESWTAFNVSSQPTAILFAADGHPIQGWQGPFPESEVLALAAASS